MIADRLPDGAAIFSSISFSGRVLPSLPTIRHMTPMPYSWERWAVQSMRMLLTVSSKRRLNTIPVVGQWLPLRSRYSVFSCRGNRVIVSQLQKMRFRVGVGHYCRYFRNHSFLLVANVSAARCARVQSVSLWLYITLPLLHCQRHCQCQWVLLSTYIEKCPTQYSPISN